MELKALIEKRRSYVSEMEQLANKTVAETRAFTDEESARYNELAAEVDKLDGTIASVSDKEKAPCRCLCSTRRLIY